MTCHRRYTFTFPGGDAHTKVLQELERQCEQYWWYSEPCVRGQGLGVMQVEFQVAARDQWWAHTRAMKLMAAAVWPHEVPTPEWETLPPHTNRGYDRVRND